HGRRLPRHRRVGDGVGGGVRDHHPRRPGREDQDGRRGHRLHRTGDRQEMTRRVVITGVGTVNPLSNDRKGYWQALLAGRSGIAPIAKLDTSAFKVKFGGEVKGFDPESVLDPKAVRRLDPFSQYALAASIEAVNDSGLDASKLDPFRAG